MLTNGLLYTKGATLLASKNKDIIQQLADTICNKLVTASTQNGKETAPNDKSFYTTILGVNRKFTDDVPADDQTVLIQKYGIPESIEEGSNSYFTFKINGAYYCKQQNGDFKLYESVMVYIPNGDWSRMYIDYPVTTGTGVATNIPHLYFSPTEPEEDVVEGDYWVKIDNFQDRHILGFYEYVVNPTTSECEWFLQYSVAAGSNVYINISHAILVQQEDVV